jgi:Flp pilus assembly protein TadG
MFGQRRERVRDRGAAAVEAALVLPLFLFIVLGGIDFGYYFFASEVVANAAREAARVGSVQATTVDPTVSAKTTATNYLTSVGLKNSPVVVKAFAMQSSSLTTSTKCGDAFASDAATGDSVWVEIKYPLGAVTGALSWIQSVVPAFDFNPHACAVMRWQ